MNDIYKYSPITNEIISKVCPSCNVEKPASDFSKDKRSSSGLRSVCKECLRNRSKEWRENNPEKYKAGYTKQNKRPQKKEVDKRCYIKHYEKRKLDNYKWRENNREAWLMHQRNSQLKRLYGITHKDYLKMLDEQNGVCKICGVDTPSGRGKYFHVDHCHKTGRVRGLLCHHCNTAIGCCEDNKEILRSAINYLKDNQ